MPELLYGGCCVLGGSHQEAQDVICPIIDDVNLDRVVKGHVIPKKKSLKSVNRQRQTNTRGPVRQTQFAQLPRSHKLKDD